MTFASSLAGAAMRRFILPATFLRRSSAPHRDVVIKALNVFLQDDLDADLERTLVENFQNEAVALDRVRHPNIISRLGHGTASDLRGSVFHYLVLEYLPGGDLQTLVRREKISIKQALEYIEQVCAGLGHAHKNGVIHRDIKPQNLLLTADRSTVKIADFGVARVHLSDSPITRVGTNIYAPPEHSPMLAGQTGTLDYARLTPAADIYSLAKSVYTIVSGEAPRRFANETLTELPDAIIDENWSHDLTRVLQKATHSDSRERHQSVEEFWGDFETVVGLAQAGGNATVKERAFSGEANSRLTSPLENGSLVNTRVSAPVVLPQAHFSLGSSPYVPTKPKFVESEPAAPAGGEVVEQEFNPANRRNDVRGAELKLWNDQSVQSNLPPAYAGGSDMAAIKARKKRSRFRRVVVFAVFLVSFTGILYGTASYTRGRGFLPEFRKWFGTQTAMANTDIYLRPSPGTENDPIGLVTKNSKVRIVNSQNNWYQVDVIEQRSDPPARLNATRGWLNGKYIDIND